MGLEAMRTEVLTLKTGAEGWDAIERVVEVLRRDGVMAYPTETFYGLGAACLSRAGVRKVYRLKKRDPRKPLSVIASDLDMVREVAASPLPPGLFRLAGEFWPGPLTVVLKAVAGFPAALLGPGGTIGLRIPPAPWLRRLVFELSAPVTATSANLAGEKELADPAEVRCIFEGRVDLIIDGGNTPGGRPSTVVDLTRQPAVILRDGAVPAGALAGYLS
jgi:L-threonylcarbamoyladenylate synthase